MNIRRGDIVLVDYPYSDRSGSKLRPALVVQSDTLNQSRADTLLAIITSTSSGRPSEWIIDLAQEPASGLKFNSAVQCDTLVTLDQGLVLKVLGSLSENAMHNIDDCLKFALDLS